MIKSFADKETEKVYEQKFSKKLPRSIQKVALRKLLMIDNAMSVNDLRIPPANHLERLTGDRQGQYSIKINAQYRICFSIENQNDFTHVEIVDYHRG
ncbi:type II toxin-antitoxin system RelE/ParE family toxin [Tetragenococcus koreensis]|nr:type II toxin-antitoxin system RelE/ParE family toxin [Tetragenococcus koreensis]MCF1584870.1 type II toxin-antitoxin system RelE/ParE family toxin [Tetragenococcus koreensis]MCF1615141.1 type II toxin-antitoxin system RelE/ParE family toxin [Tetragenococcus koreensis]MCF1616805.1 type II toxin-antitoxin system RelE/ParE family toxin [Tetragenococcus koreensis]MCF1622431.1 type II toxin-antitoxin system RelE/ParE family toxin [Tetragenococcus koreensis]MCF1624475.1 type II toxin-antitoxin s